MLLIFGQIPLILATIKRKKDVQEKYKTGAENDSELSIEQIESLELDELHDRILLLMGKRKEFQKALDISADASIQFDLKNKIKVLNLDIERLKKRLSTL